MTIALSIAATAALYAWGVLRARARGRAIAPLALAAFAAGLVALAASLEGPLDDLADSSLSWHMVQHFALTSVVAPLLLLGAPVRVALAAAPPAGARALARVLASRPVAFLTQPAIAWLQFMLVLYGAHFSPLYEAALENETVHAFEHLALLGSALIFWTPVLAVAPAPHAPSHLVRILMVFLALPVMSFLGFIFYVAHRVFYAHYAALPGALADQTNAGAVMWIAGGAPLFAAMLALVADWGARERRLET
jgi:cytochrome c oxidase assembly factor CtaG